MSAAGWLRMRHDVLDQPEVAVVASALGLADPDYLLGKLHLLWSWVSRQSEDGTARAGTTRTAAMARLDSLARQPGLAAAMEGVGWLVVREDGTVEVPGFERWSGSAKKAQRLARERQARCRAAEEEGLSRSCHAPVTRDNGVTSRVTEALPGRGRERGPTEKREERRENGEPEVLSSPSAQRAEDELRSSSAREASSRSSPGEAKAKKPRAKPPRSEAEEIDLAGLDALRPDWLVWIEHVWSLRKKPTASVLRAWVAALSKIAKARGIEAARGFLHECIAANAGAFHAWAIQRAIEGGQSRQRGAAPPSIAPETDEQRRRREQAEREIDEQGRLNLERAALYREARLKALAEQDAAKAAEARA